MDAPIIYSVIAHVHPDILDDYVAWLEGGHIADVLSAPGFLWAKKTTLKDKNDDGWTVLINHFGVESLEALATYQQSDLVKGFAKEFEPFGDRVRIHRTTGEVDFTLDN